MTQAGSEYSGSPLFEQFVRMGCRPEAFNKAFTHFTVRHPTSDFGKAVESVSREPGATRRVALAVDLFGRTGAEIAAFCRSS
jgi:hypothetical protein